MKEVEELKEAEEVKKAEEQSQSKEPARSLDFAPFDRHDNPPGDSARQTAHYLAAGFFLRTAGRAQKIDQEGPGAIDLYARFPLCTSRNGACAWA